MLRQRVYGLALGWEDLSDHGTLREDVAMQTAIVAAHATTPGMARAKDRVSGRPGLLSSAHPERLRTRRCAFIVGLARQRPEFPLSCSGQHRRIISDPINPLSRRGPASKRFGEHPFGQPRHLARILDVVRVVLGLHAELASSGLCHHGGGDLGQQGFPAHAALLCIHADKLTINC